MERKEFIKVFAEQTGLTQKSAKIILEKFADALEIGLMRDGEVAVTKLGRFVTTTVPGRIGVNPRTKEKMPFPSYTKISLKPEKAYKNKFQEHSEKEK